MGSLKYSKNCLQFPFAMRYRSSTELTQRSCNRSQDSINCPGLQNHQLTKITFSFLYRCIDFIIIIFFVSFICTYQKKKLINFNLTNFIFVLTVTLSVSYHSLTFLSVFANVHICAGEGVGEDSKPAHAVFVKPNIA